LKPGVTQLVILDPGLREIGGHHPAFILALLGTDLFTRDDTRLRVFANTAFTPNAVLDNETHNVEYTPFFENGFYRYFYKSTHHPELPSFIRRLTAQYCKWMLKHFIDPYVGVGACDCVSKCAFSF
jgi:hypothetical protein